MSLSNDDVPLLAELTESEREEAMHRYEIIEPLLEVGKPTAKMWQEAARKGSCSVKTLRRWCQNFAAHGLIGLARKRRVDKEQRRTVPIEMQRLIEALYLEKSHRTIRNVYRLIKAYAEKSALPIPSYSTVYNICNALPPTLVTMAREGEHVWRDQYEPVLRFESSRPDECWQMDHCQLDVLVVDDTGEKVLGRPWLTLALDTYSRAVPGYYLSLTPPSSLSICFALRRAILEKPSPLWPMCGIPERLHIDRGRDFISKHLSQVAADLCIQLSFASAYLARAKGKVERVFDTLNMQLWSELPGYVGGSVADRPHIVRPELTLREVEAYLLAFLINHYHHQVHSTTGEPPLLRWQQANFQPRLPVNERELDLLLMFTEERTVQRTGIRFYHLDYWSYELVNLIGERVLIRYDPENIQELVVYHDNEFVCVTTTPHLQGVEINLADWRALQAQRRRSIKEVVTAYEDWLAAKRASLVPLIDPEELDLIIIMERTIAAAQMPPKIALLPSDKQPKLLPAGNEEEIHE